MTREVAVTEWVIPTIRRTWNEKKCDEILKALKQEPCDDAISRQDLREPRFIIAENDYQKGWNDALDSVYENAPSVTPAEKVGRWIYIGNSEVNGLKICKCSNCKKKTYGSHNYCPNCGAMMQEVES